DPAKLGSAQRRAARGLADDAPVSVPPVNEGLSLRPLPPVHPRWSRNPAGDLALRWTRRARGAWQWPDNIDAPLNEQAEAYRVGIGEPVAPLMLWDVATPQFTIPATSLAALPPTSRGAPVWVRQIGSHDLSAPLLLTTLP